MRRWWVSWYQRTQDFRPLHDPPNEAIRGWWCSGEDADGVAILCAVVDAPTSAAARKAVKLDWPEAAPWRFQRETTALGPPGDRFPATAGWMKERLARLLTTEDPHGGTP